MSEENLVVASPPPKRRRYLARAVLWLFIVLVALVAGLIAWLPTQSALDLAIARVVLASGGRLSVRGVEGSVTSTIRATELRWEGPEATVVAREVALDWNPWRLFSRSVSIHGLGAQSISIEMHGGQERNALPTSLALPIDIAIDHLGVGTLDWSLGGRRGRITGLEFAYAGGATGHRVSNFAMVVDRGRLAGEASIAAEAPFATRARIGFVGAGDLARAQMDADLAGPLERLAANATGRFAEAGFTARAEVTPFAGVPIATLALDAREVDLAKFDARWPSTTLGVVVDAKPVDGGFAGTLDATNARAGALDTGRVPLDALAAKFALRDDQLTLEDVVASLPGGGRARGRGTIGLTSAAPMTWTLTVDNLDLRRIHSKLTATRVQGTLAADLDAERQRITGDVSDRALGLGLGFAATVAQRRVEITRARLSAGGGTLDGSGRIALDGAQAFTFAAEALHFDPARFGDFPAGSLDGKLRVAGTLAPAWRAETELTLAPGSKLAGLAAAGSAKATLTAISVSDAVLELRLGSTKIAAHGAAGNPGDRIEFSLDARDLAELAPFAPPQMPRPLSGAVRVTGIFIGDPGGPGGKATLHGENLKIGTLATAASVDAHLDVAPGGAGAKPLAFTARHIAVEFSGKKLIVAATPLATARIGFDGTLGQHTLKVDAAGDGFTVDAAAHGGIKGEAGRDSLAWAGVLDSVTARGALAFHLTAPASIEVGRHRGHIGATELALANGHIQLEELSWDAQRVATRGRFDGVRATSVAQLAGYELPLATSLVLAGEWSLASTPRLNGVLKVRREGGDVFGTASATPDQGDFAFGIHTLALDARIVDDALDGSATLRSERGGDADATFSVAAGAVAGRIATDSAFAAKVEADLASLAPLQRWLGTFAALSGRAHVALAGKGTLAAPKFDGTLSGDALRFDSPRVGVHLTDGRVRARLADNVLTLDELSLTGGDGRFEAHGTLARAGTAGGTKVTWSATNFRAVNRPDLRLVVGGEGTLAIVERKILLNGKVAVVEGRVDYRRPSGSALGDDVVVIGRPRESAPERSGLSPLALDLEVDLGQRLHFEGEGLSTGLEGRVHVTTSADGALLGRGSISAVNGTYYAFGQTLTIDRGQLIFDGPLDNPALDIIALRKNLAVEAGVALTGTVRVPQVRLTSNPPVPDGERLAWLVTGQGVNRGSGADAAALSAASAMLLGTGGKPVGAQIAQQFGLDDISVRGSSTSAGAASGSSAASGQVIAFGKRITDRINIVYEQGLTVANNALRIEYTLSRTLTLRAEAGLVSAVGVYYRRTFE